MASLGYLWQNRARFKFGSFLFFKSWAKRIILIPELYVRNKNRRYLRRRGAVIHNNAEIGTVKAEGNKKNLSIGSFSFIGRIEFALHDKIQIGSKVCINDGVILLTASHSLIDPEWKHVKGPIIIDDYAWICTNSIILPGVHIGRGAVVGAGAIVSKDVGDYEIVAGNPAQAIPKKRISELNYNPCEFLAVNRAWLKG